MDSPHSIRINERNETSVTGVTDVLSFDDLQIEAETSRGTLALQGEALRIAGLDRTTGELSITGRIDKLAYVEPKKKKRLSLREAFGK
ncbi:MAG: YabP/YqfC family sporulation protein [Clostridia bacterium]|nr:YabP/YqfC family sporulation protein [Clostridia bacterium]